MKTPRWSVLLVAILLGLVTGDFLVHTQAETKQSAIEIQQPSAHEELQLESFFLAEN